MSCINKNSEEFKNLLKETGYSKTVLAAKIDAFQKKKGIDSFPTAKDLLIKETETTFKNIVGFPIDDRDKEKVDKKEILSKGFSFLKDKKGNNIPHSYVEEFTSTLANLFFSIREDENVSNKNVFKEIEQELQDKYEFHKSITKKEHLTSEVLEEAPATIKENQLLADYFKHIIDNKEVYFDRVVDKIKKMGFTMSSNSTKLDEISEESKDAEYFQEEAELDELSEISTETEKRYNDDASSLRENPLDKLSPIIKRFLSFIPSDKPGILGLDTYESADEIYSSLLNLTANKELTYEELIALLEDNAKSKPYYQYLVDELTKSEKDLSQEELDTLNDLRITFAKHFRLTYYTSKTVITKNTNGVTKAQVMNTNRNSVVNKVREEWLDNSLTSDIFKESTGKTVLNTRAVNSKFTAQWERIKESDYDINEVKLFLNMMGINISTEALEEIKNNNLKYRLGSWNSLFAKGSMFDTIFNYVKSIDPEKNIEDENPLANENYITTLAKIEANFRPESVVDNYKDGKNKSRYSHILPTWLFNRFYRIKNNKNNLVDKLKSLSVNKFSYWLGMLSSGNKAFKDNFNLEIFDSNSIDENTVSFDEMSPREKLITQINLFANRNNGKKGEKVSVFMTPSKSDKTTLHLLTSVRYEVKSKTGSLKKGIIDDNDKRQLLNIVKGEYARIIDAQNKRREGIDFNDIEGYDPFRFYIYPKLNEIEKLWVGGELINYDMDSTVEDTDSTIEDILWEVVKESTLTQMEELKNTLIKEEIIVDVLDKDRKVSGQKLKNIDKDFVENEGSVEYFLADYIINYNIALANYDLLFQGDIAFAFKKDKGVAAAITNMFKRLAKDIAPASRMAYFKNNKGFNQYNQIFLADAFNSSNNIEQLKKILGERHKDFLGIEGTDAQELTTLEEHLDVMHYYGKLKTSQYKKLIRKAKLGKEFSEEELDIFLQPIKPVHVGSYILDEYGAEVPVYIKTSSFPLVPQMIKGTELAKLEKVMRENKIRRASFLSGTKLGAYKVIDPWNKVKDESGNIVKYGKKELTDGTFNEELLNKAVKSGSYLTLDRDNFGIQQDTPFDPDKGSILEGSQLMKLILEGIKDPAKIKEFHDLHIGLLGESFDLFLNDIGTIRNPDGSFLLKDITKLQELLIKELKEGNNKFTQNDVLALELNEDKTDFKIPLWASAKSSQYEALLNSIINKKIIKNKLAGKSYILGTEEGFIGKAPGIKKVSESKLIGTAYDPETGLKPQRYGYVKGNQRLEESEYKKLENKEGWKKIVFPAQVLMAKGTKFKGTKLVGYRIPTQGLNSMAAMEVVGYLPDYMADLIITPKDFTKQFGSDFDIDKIYIHRWYEDKRGNHYNIESVQAEWKAITDSAIAKESDPIRVAETLANMFKVEEFRYTEEEVQEIIDIVLAKFPTEEEYIKKRNPKIVKNKIVDIYWETLIDPENLPEILSPLDMGSLPEVAKEIEEAEKKSGNSSSTEYLSPLRQIENYENGTAGKFGVAVTSLVSTFNSLVKALPEKVTLNISFNINGEEVDQIKGDIRVISAFQSASVDNIKELLIKTLNYNRDTHDAFTTLTLLGANERFISLLLAQPIIKEFVSEIKNAGDSYATKKTKKEKISNVKRILLKNLEDKAKEKSKITNKPIEFTREDEKDLDFNKDFSEEDLLKQISNPNLKTQAEILKKFIVLSTYGEEINNLVRVIRPSTSGMGKNRLEANNIIVKLKEVLTSLRNKKSLIKGAEQLIGEIKLSSKTGIEKINPTTFTGAGLNIIKQSNDLFNRFFKINKIHADLLQAISENKGGPLSFSAKEQENALKFIKSYLFSANLSMYRGKSVTEIRNELLFGENTLAHRWSNFKQSNPDHWLGKRIFPKISPSQVKPNRIEYKAAIIDSSGDIRNITELTEMLLSDDVTIKQLAEDTINYAYLTGGIQDAVSLVKFININYLNMYGFGNNIHDLSKQVDINILEEQFYQNYPQYTNSVDIFGIEKEDYEVGKDGILYINSSEEQLIPTYIHDIVKGTYKIYKLFPSNSNRITYKEISRLGTTYFTETHFNVSESVSTIKLQVPTELQEASNDEFFKTELPKVIESENKKEKIIEITQIPSGYESLQEYTPQSEKTTVVNEITDKNSVSLSKNLISEGVEVESVNTEKQDIIYEVIDISGKKISRNTKGFKINFKGHPATEFYLLEDLNDNEEPVWSILNKIEGKVRIPTNEENLMGSSSQEEALKIFVGSLNEIIKKLGTNTEGLARLETLKFNFTNSDNIQFTEEELVIINNKLGTSYTLEKLNSLSEEVKRNRKNCL